MYGSKQDHICGAQAMQPAVQRKVVALFTTNKRKRLLYLSSLCQWQAYAITRCRDSTVLKKAIYMKCQVVE